MIGYLYLFFALLGISLGQVMLKKHSMQEKKISLYLVLSLILFIGVPIWTYLALQYIAFVFVFLSNALAISLVVLFSALFLNEKLNKHKILAIIFILLGILLLNIESN